jgi:hypothetical protein
VATQIAVPHRNGFHDGTRRGIKRWNHTAAARKGKMKLDTPIGDAQEEFYIFLRLAEGELSEAIKTLDHIAMFENEFVKLCLLKQAAIDYCKPFTEGRGFFKKHSLAARNNVPTRMLGLHRKLCDLRDKVFAHTDIKARNPKLHAWTKGRAKPIFPIVFKTHDYPLLLRRVDEIRTLFRAVLDAIQAEQVELEARFSVEIESVRGKPNGV